jgi:hypothetical protein
VNARTAGFQMQPLGDRSGQLASRSSYEWDLAKAKELSY